MRWWKRTLLGMAAVLAALSLTACLDDLVGDDSDSDSDQTSQTSGG